MTIPLLEIRELRLTLKEESPRALVDDVSLSIGQGESVGLVGESGSGKSLTAKAALRLLPSTIEVKGSVDYNGRSVLDLSRRELSRYRSTEVGMIHQDPRAHTNPLRTVGDFLIEGVVATKQMKREQAESRACELLREMGIGDAARRMGQYPHQLSGGLLQRVMIAMALLPEPRLILADEPTTALDVTVQSEVMAILVEQVQERGLGMLFITHDLDLAAAVSDTLVVMYAGTVVESGPAQELYGSPRHPYTAALLGSRPSTTEIRRLVAIPGRPAAAHEVSSGCSFAARCPFVNQRCLVERPKLRQVAGHVVACHRAEELGSALKPAVSA